MTTPINLSDFKLDHLYTKLGLRENDKVGREAAQFVYHVLHDELASTDKTTKRIAMNTTYEALNLRNTLFHGYHEDFFKVLGQPNQTDAMYIAALCGHHTPLLNTRELDANGDEKPLYPIHLDDNDTQAAQAFWAEALDLTRSPIREPVDEYYAEALFVAHIQASQEVHYALENFDKHDKAEHVAFDRDILPIFQGFALPTTHIGHRLLQNIDRFRAHMDSRFSADIVPIFGTPENGA